MGVKFLDIPFIPTSDVVAVIIDARVPNQIEKNILGMGIKPVKMPLCDELYDSIACHPDILLHPVDSQNIVVSPNIYNTVKNDLEILGFNLIKGEKILMGNYPDNIAYNIARIGNYAVHNLNYTDKKTYNLLKKKGISFIHVKQGYAKCSICVVSECAIITSDAGIAKTIRENNYDIDVLEISKGYIDLPGLDYGFIGGASGLLGKDKLAFLGDLSKHPDYARILKFLKKHDVYPIFLTNYKIRDFGSIIPILQMSY